MHLHWQAVLSWFVQEELQVVPRLLAMLDSPVATLRAKALVSFALLTQTHLALLLQAFQVKLSPQVICHALVAKWILQGSFLLHLLYAT